jgi:hypothetical protein
MRLSEQTKRTIFRVTIPSSAMVAMHVITVLPNTPAAFKALATIGLYSLVIAINVECFGRNVSGPPGD